MTKETHSITWREITVEIGYDPAWLNLTDIDGSIRAHLEMRAVQPDRSPLPVTATGYRSHFTTPDIIDGAGGPAAFVRAWLDHEAGSAAWKTQQDARQQLSLF